MGQTCVAFNDGNFCAKTCAAAGECRQGYQCEERNLPIPRVGTANVCTPL